MLKCIISFFKKKYVYIFKRECIFKDFFSQTFTWECIYKIFLITMYVQKVFLRKEKKKKVTYVQKFRYMYKILKDNVFTKFQRRVYV